MEVLNIDTYNEVKINEKRNIVTFFKNLSNFVFTTCTFQDIYKSTLEKTQAHLFLNCKSGKENHFVQSILSHSKRISLTCE